MSRKRIATALALAAVLVSALPATAAPRPAPPRAVEGSAAALVRQGLAWISALWGGRERSTAARAEATGGSAPSSGTATTPVSTGLATRPAGGGIDPDGLL